MIKTRSRRQYYFFSGVLCAYDTIIASGSNVHNRFMENNKKRYNL